MNIWSQKKQFGALESNKEVLQQEISKGQRPNLVKISSQVTKPKVTSRCYAFSQITKEKACMCYMGG